MAQQQHESVEIDMDLSSEEIKDWSGEGFGPPDVPPGEYVLDIVAAYTKSSKNNNPMVVVEFQVADGEFAGKQLTGWYTLTDAARGRIKRLMMAVGARLDKIRTDELLGGKLRATITHEPGQTPTNPDGTVKTGSDGQPLAPRLFAKVLNERPTEEAEKHAQKAAAPNPPPVTRGTNNAKATTPATRRA